MKRRRCAVVLAMLFFIAALMSACGKEEYVAELGIDGSVYVSERVLRTGGIGNLKIAGDYLYYTQNGGNEVSRVSLADAFPEEGLPDFSKGNTILAVSSGEMDMPAEVEEALEEAASALYSASESDEMAGQGKIKFWLSLKSFVVDRDQRLYYVLQAYVNKDFAIEPAGYILCSQNGDGQQGYKAFWQEIEDLAVDGEGNVYVLTSEGICIVDSEGRKAGVVSLDGYQAGGMFSGKSCLGIWKGMYITAPTVIWREKALKYQKAKAVACSCRKQMRFRERGMIIIMPCPKGISFSIRQIRNRFYTNMTGRVMRFESF